ncbi:B2 bradykinin receptor-like [Eucyclogobius newberryi]|uniref:B2 bradykinin receptor-like n=1 Tax=Eucyclogobius newberryi TaxID=166745 RepID=UPI003B5C4562
MNTSWIPPFIYTISALGILLNLLVLLVFLLHKKNCTATEIYLSNMAAADLLLMVFMPFWGVYTANNNFWTFGGPMCKIVSLLMVMNYTSSVYFLVLVCIDRYLALVHPLSHCKLHSRKYAKFGCFLVWCFGFLLNIPTLLCKEYAKNACRWVCSHHVHFAKEFIQTIAAFVIPLLIILFCTVKIVQALRGRPTQAESTQHTEHKATILVLAVLLAFFICWAPFILTRMFELAVRYQIIKQTCAISYYLVICRHVFLNLGFFNSDLNPVLYVLVGKNFRKKMWEVVRSGSLTTPSTQFATSTSTLSSQMIKVNATSLK